MPPWPLQCTHAGKGNDQWQAKWGVSKACLESRFAIVDCKGCNEGKQYKNTYLGIG